MNKKSSKFIELLLYDTDFGNQSPYDFTTDLLKYNHSLVWPFRFVSNELLYTFFHSLYSIYNFRFDDSMSGFNKLSWGSSYLARDLRSHNNELTYFSYIYTDTNVVTNFFGLISDLEISKAGILFLNSMSHVENIGGVFIKPAPALKSNYMYEIPYSYQDYPVIPARNWLEIITDDLEKRIDPF